MEGTVTNAKLQWTKSAEFSALAQEIDPRLSIHPQVEEFLTELADEFLENVGSFAAQLAKHRRSTVLEAKDIQFCLKKNWNIHIHGHTSAEALNASSSASSSMSSRKKETAQDVIKPQVSKGRSSIHAQRLELVTKVNHVLTKTSAQQQPSQPQQQQPPPAAPPAAPLKKAKSSSNGAPPLPQQAKKQRKEKTTSTYCTVKE